MQTRYMCRWKMFRSLAGRTLSHFCLRGMQICKSMKLENVHEVKKILGEEHRPKDRTSGKLQESRADEEQKLTGPEKIVTETISGHSHHSNPVCFTFV